MRLVGLLNMSLLQHSLNSIHQPLDLSQVYEDGRATARVFSAAPQTRSDRRKDRVETNPEQLAAAAAEAERLSLLSGQETRVIGWYHSHPHITVFPSHVGE